MINSFQIGLEHFQSGLAVKFIAPDPGELFQKFYTLKSDAAFQLRQFTRYLYGVNELIMSRFVQQQMRLNRYGEDMT